MNQYIFKNKTTVLTGGASGIGLALANKLAELGSDLAIIDCNDIALKKVCDDLKSKYPKLEISGYKLDLSKISEIPKTIKKITSDHKRIGLLINNAGIAMGGKIEELSLDDIEQVFTINFRSQVSMIKELLPYLKKIKGSHIANVSSIFGIITPAGQSAYAASKFAVRGFSGVLRQELKNDEIGVSTIFPGGVKTNIAANARIGKYANAEKTKKEAKKFESNLTMTPEYAADVIINGIKKRKPLIVIGSMTKFLHLATCLLPAKYDFLLKSIK